MKSGSTRSSTEPHLRADVHEQEHEQTKPPLGETSLRELTGLPKMGKDRGLAFRLATRVQPRETRWTVWLYRHDKRIVGTK